MRTTVRYSPPALRKSLASTLRPLLDAAIGRLDGEYPARLSVIVGPHFEDMTGGRYEHHDHGLARIRLDVNDRLCVPSHLLAHELGHLLIDSATHPITSRTDGWLLLNEYAAERIGYQLLQETRIIDWDTTADNLERELLEVQFLWRASMAYVARAQSDAAADDVSSAKLGTAADRLMTHFVYMSAAIDALPIAREESIWKRDLPDSVARALATVTTPADKLFPNSLSCADIRSYMSVTAPLVDEPLDRLMEPREFASMINTPGSTPTRVLEFNRPILDLFES